MLKLKCAIIGCGGLGKSHLSNVVTMEDVEIVALCDVDEEQFTKATNTNLGAGATIDVSNFNLYTQAEEMLGDRKVLGIKIHPAYHGYDIDDYAEELFAFAAKHQSFVLMHPQKIERMAFYADRYPEMKLIIAHLGSIEHVDAIAAARYGNIYTDTSGSASSNNNILEYAVSRVGSEKIFFGTDTYSCAFQFGRVALSALSLEEKENVLFKNAMQHFPWAFDAISALNEQQ